MMLKKKEIKLNFAQFKSIKVMGKGIDNSAFRKRYITSDLLVLTWGDNEWNCLF